MVWSGTKTAIRKIKTLTSYFLWAGRDSRTPARVAWSKICRRKGDGGLGILDPDQALTALLCKWILHALRPSCSNIQLFLRYRLLRTFPNKTNKWSPDPTWILQPQPRIRPGSKLWTRIGRAWQQMAPELHLGDPQSYYELWNRPLWWENELRLVELVSSKERGAALHKQGMRLIRHIWNQEEFRLYSWEEINTIYQMDENDWTFWRRLELNFPIEWTSMLRNGVPPVHKGEWLAIYRDEDEELPGLVFKASFKHCGAIEGELYTLTRPDPARCYTVGKQSGALHLDTELTQFINSDSETQEIGQRPHNIGATSGTLTKVRVVPLTKGEKENKKTTLLFYSPLQHMTLDPKWFRWRDGSHLHDYSAKKGRTFLRNRAPAWDLASEKWHGSLPPRYNFRWDAL